MVSTTQARATREAMGAWVWFLSAGILCTAAYYSFSTQQQSVIDDALAVASAGAIFVGIALRRPEPRFAWLLVGFGTLLLALGDVVFGVAQPSVPSPADMLYISAYPLLALGLMALARSRLPGANDSRLIDAIGLAGGIALVGLVVLVVPTGRPNQMEAAAKAVAIAYPVGDLILLAILDRPIRSAVARGMPFLLMAAGVVLRLLGDVSYAMDQFGAAYTVGGAADATWLLSFACFGAAALHPAIAREGALTWTGQSGWNAALSGAWVSTAPSPADELADLRGLAAAAAGSARDDTASTRSRPITLRQAIRFRLVIAWAGAGLVAMAGATTLAGGRSTETLLLAGAYLTTGAFVLIASAVRA